jgi:hypothetical protein
MLAEVFKIFLINSKHLIDLIDSIGNVDAKVGGPVAAQSVESVHNGLCPGLCVFLGEVLVFFSHY